MTDDAGNGWDMTTAVEATILTPGGIAQSAGEILAWADDVAARIRTKLGPDQISMWIRGYSWSGYDYLSCDFDTADGEVYIMTSGVAAQLYLHWTEPAVLNLAEALHMAGLLANRLNARTLIDAVVEPMRAE